MTVLISPVFEQYISCNTTATKCKRSFTGYLTFLSVATLLYIVISITTPPGASHCSRFQFHKHKPKRPIRSAHRTAFPRNAHICIHSISYAYPWRCLCFGFSQITLMLPLRLMILHFSQIGFTDDLTFTAILLSFRHTHPGVSSSYHIVYTFGQSSPGTSTKSLKHYTIFPLGKQVFSYLSLQIIRPLDKS